MTWLVVDSKTWRISCGAETTTTTLRCCWPPRDRRSRSEVVGTTIVSSRTDVWMRFFVFFPHRSDETCSDAVDGDDRFRDDRRRRPTRTKRRSTCLNDSKNLDRFSTSAPRIRRIDDLLYPAIAQHAA